jgi:hypothetical protein
LAGLVALLMAAAVLVTGNRAGAEVIYASTGTGNMIDTVNTATGTVTPLFTVTNGPPDDLITDGPGILLYLAQANSVAGAGQVRMYNLNTQADTLVATGLNRPADLVLDPGGATALVSDSSTGQISRVNLSTGAITLLPTTYPIGTNGIGPNGLAYDASGRLFANIGDRNGGPTGSNVAQINPVTGAVISQTTGLNSVDGLTYDPFSGRLFAASTLGSVLYSINPANLADVTSITLPSQADGVISNGHGLLYIGGRGTNAPIYQYNLVTSTLSTPVPSVPGADTIDLAQAVPEPSSFVLLAISATSLAVVAARRRGRTG